MANELIKQAIADAKLLRNSAYELAKNQIAETFGPKVQEMIRLKLSEMEDDSLEEKKDEEKEIKEGPDGFNVDDATLDELLAELDSEDESVVEAEKEETETETETDDTEEAGDGDADADDMGAEGDVSDEQVADISVEELKDVIRDVIMDVMAGGEGEEGMGDEVTDDGMGGDNLDLDATGGEDEEITLDEILASLEEKDQDAIQEKKEDKEEKKEGVSELKKVQSELREAVKCIKFLREEQVKLNLLNSKLLYSNKIFKNKSLSEGQKLKVISAFDRANTVKEAKRIFETLSDSFTPQKTKKTSIREAIGFASKPAGIIPKAKPIVEQDDVVNRWQVLAGIKK